MTINYIQSVNSRRFLGFARLIWRWKGGIWKSVYREMTAWLIAYLIINSVYRYGLNAQQQGTFERFVAFCNNHLNAVPIVFTLGFFYTLLSRRWWDMFECFGWIDNVALYVATYVNGRSERMRMTRRNIVRYTVMAQALVFRDISSAVRNRFPTELSFVDEGYLTINEWKSMQTITTTHPKYWLPIHWAFNLVKEARVNGDVAHDRAVELVLERMREFRTGLTRLRAYNLVPISLVYTQVVLICVRTYLLFMIIGRQYTYTSNAQFDTYLPITSIMDLIFYLGWMKAGESLINPFGDRDDDFECNWFLDRNLHVSLAIVDNAIGKEPPLEKDKFFPERSSSIDDGEPSSSPVITNNRFMQTIPEIRHSIISNQSQSSSINFDLSKFPNPSMLNHQRRSSRTSISASIFGRRSSVSPSVLGVERQSSRISATRQLSVMIPHRSQQHDHPPKRHSSIKEGQKTGSQLSIPPEYQLSISPGLRNLQVIPVPDASLDPDSGGDNSTKDERPKSPSSADI